MPLFKPRPSDNRMINSVGEERLDRFRGAFAPEKTCAALEISKIGSTRPQPYAAAPYSGVRDARVLNRVDGLEIVISPPLKTQLEDVLDGNGQGWGLNIITLSERVIMPKVRILNYSFLVVCISLCGSAVNAQEGQLQLDVQSLSSGLSRLETTIRETVDTAGGNLETQGVHLVLAFKTGYFKDDPVRGRAAREVATRLTRDLLVSGDRVTARAYEFGLWNYRPPDEITVQITQSRADDPEKTDAVAALLPTTPKAGSRGGHDLERAITELATAYEGNSSTIIVLIGNIAASQGAPGEQLMGSNALEYEATLERWTRVSGTQNGASVEIPFKVNVPNASPSEAKLEAVVLVSKTFAGETLTGGTRSELLGSTSAAPVASETAGFPWLLVPILAILGVAITFMVRAMSGSGGSGHKTALEINGQRFQIASTANGRSIVTLVGRGYVKEGDEPMLEVDKAPPEQFARINRDANGVRVENLNAEFRLTEIDGVPPLEPARIKYDAGAGEHELIFEGKVISATGVSRQTRVTVMLGLLRGE